MGKAKTNQKLTKVEIDNNINELLDIQSKMDTLAKREKAIKVLLESQYEKDAGEKEFLYGNKMYMEKVPVDRGKNNYNIETLKTFLKAIRGGMKVIKKIEIIDTAALDNLVKIGKLPSEVLDNCRDHKFTFKNLFKKIEVNATANPENKKEAI